MVTEQELYEQDKRLMDKYLQAMFVYTSALLTVNGLLLSLFAADALSTATRPGFLTYSLIGSCIVSLWILLYNVRAIKQAYWEMGREREEFPDPPPERLVAGHTNEERIAIAKQYWNEYSQEKQKEAAKKSDWREYRTTLVEGLLVVETLIVILMLATS